MRIWILPIIVFIGFFIAGVSNLYVRLTEPGISEVSIENVDAIRGQRRVKITGGKLDVIHSFVRYDPVLRGMESSRVSDVFIPYVARGASANNPVKVVLVTRKSEIKDAFQKLSSHRKTGDIGEGLMSYVELTRLASSKTSIEGLVVGSFDSDQDLESARKEIPNLSQDFIVIEDGEDISIFSGIGYLGCAGFAALAGWIIRPRKSSGPPPIPPHLRKTN